MKINVSFSVDAKQDQRITDWLDKQRNKSESIRNAIYAQLDYETVTGNRQVSSEITTQLDTIETKLDRFNAALQNGWSLMKKDEAETIQDVPIDIISNILKLA